MTRFRMKHSPVVILAILLVASIFLPDNQVGLDSIPLIKDSKPPPIVIPSRSDVTPCLVKVTNHHPTKTLSGSGVVVQHDEKPLVLTSHMIFTRGGGAVVANVAGKQYPASVLAEDKTWGLTALAIYADKTLPTVELIEENLTVGAEVEIRKPGAQAASAVTASKFLRPPKTSRSIGSHWMLLDGDIPRGCSGAPVIIDDRVAGIVIGLNQANEKQAIAADAEKLLELIKKAAHCFPEAQSGLELLP